MKAIVVTFAIEAVYIYGEGGGFDDLDDVSREIRMWVSELENLYPQHYVRAIATPVDDIPGEVLT